MSRYRDQDLFGSGPHRFVVHGRAMRLVEHDLAGADGVKAAALGRTARRIDQTGTLVADDLAGLQSLMDAMESVIDGATGTLLTDTGQSLANVMMVEFEPGSIYRIGPRLAVDYQIQYTQVQS